MTDDTMKRDIADLTLLQQALQTTVKYREQRDALLAAANDVIELASWHTFNALGQSNYDLLLMMRAIELKTPGPHLMPSGPW